MTIDPTLPLKELALSNAGARVLERYHLENNVLFPRAQAMADCRS